MNDAERPVEAIEVNTKQPFLVHTEVEDAEWPVEAVEVKTKQPVEDAEWPVKAVMVNTKRPVLVLKDKNGPEDFVSETKPPVGAETAIDKCLGGSQGDIGPCLRPGDDTESDADNLMK